MDRELIVRFLGRVPYASSYTAMREFTETRTPQTPDELWLLEHPPVFTQGQAGKAEHVLAAGDIPVVASNRGGQVTYHGPGQLVMYPLLDLHRRGIGIRGLVSLLENAMIATVARYGIHAFARSDAPGVYVEQVFDGHTDTRKLGSVGLRVSRGCSYHGLSLNVAMDLEPFSRINPCGYAGLRMTQISELGGSTDVDAVGRDLAAELTDALASQDATSPPEA
ncbi:lipoyl(octanoyl) transferase [Panacagrimonas perspica]|uniref:Octanoyltransferase n=1 Tax=Panacagrimonas perspica TaxID=381431 RepID=A0A4R7P087_9GAMM|nr:lipoyl(octanoyl) transferase [Panacagrimonas perspica]THD03603.1 octanoyltransferase [Panacagrimonas perspica]